MADEESNETLPPAEQPAEVVEPAEPKKTPAEQKAEMKSQLMGLVTLLVVFGLLWGLVKVMPTLGEKLTSGISSVTSKGDAEAGSEDKKSEQPDAETPKKAETVEPEPVVAKLKTEEPAVEKVTEPDPAAVAAEPATDESIPDDKVKAQILEAIGGVERGEVRHIAFSSDRSKMIASLKMTPEGGEATLIEVIFERDDFGRYISSEDSPFDTPIKIWK